MEGINWFGQIQRLGTMPETGLRCVPFQEKLLRLGLHSLPRRWVLPNLIVTLKIFTSLSDVYPNMFFLRSTPSDIRDHPYKAHPHPPNAPLIFLANKHFHAVQTLPGTKNSFFGVGEFPALSLRPPPVISIYIFKQGLGQVLTVFSLSSHIMLRLTPTSPILYTLHFFR